VQRSRPEGYETEVEIAYRVEGADPPLEVRGRIDGLYASQEPVIIEEIKTTTLSLDLVSEEHNPCIGHRRSAMLIWLPGQHKLSEISIHLTYYHLDSGEQSSGHGRRKNLRAPFYALAELQTFFCDLITPYLDWFRKVHAWQARRDQSIQQLDFPYVDYRQASERWPWRSTKPSGPMTACMSNRLRGWEDHRHPFPGGEGPGAGTGCQDLLPDSQNVRTPGGRKGAG
jgi:DNA excision repair protein ERCC-2